MSESKNFPRTSQRLSELLLDSVMTNTSDAIVLTNPDNKIIAWNASAESLLGYPASEAIGQYINLIIDDSTLAEIKNASHPHNTITLKKSSGGTLPVLLQFDQVVDDEMLVAVCYVFRNAQDAPADKANAEDRTRAMQSFTYSVSHDLRAPLRRIINYAQILEEDHKNSLSEEVARLISRMSKNADKMNELLDGLLSYSRVDQQPLQKNIVNVESLVNGLVSELQKQPDTSRIAFTVRNMERCEADHALLRRAFENLLSNAIKFTRTKDAPTIEIGYAATSDTHNYYVKDNGVGFDMQYSYKLFNIFQRLHNPVEFEGIGVGLAIVHNIISRHGGKARAEGSVNEGAVFWISIPK